LYKTLTWWLSTPFQNTQTGWRIELDGVLSICLNDTYRVTGTVATKITANFGDAKSVACVSINQSTPITWLSARETWRIPTTNFLPFGSHEILCCSYWVESVIGTEANLGEQCSGVWYQGDHRNYRITCTHYMINERYGMLYLSRYIYSCNFSTGQEIYRALSQLRSFIAEISPPRPGGSIRRSRPFGICSESCGNGTLFLWIKYFIFICLSLTLYTLAIDRP
jgi:hypothetical protein